MYRLALALALCGAPAVAQDIPFDPSGTLACLDGGGAVDTCAGRAAQACMDAVPGGGTTVGMGGCLWAEADWWDARLNAAYGALMDRHRASDAELAELGATAPSLADALRAMQRAWIPFRDATCDYERAQWGGGTGQGPAGAECTMRLTARQAIELERRLREAE